MRQLVRSILFTLAFATAAVSWANDAPAKVNINTATAEQLAAGLNGVGPAKAEAIVAWREQNGPFKAAAQLSEVKGIGDALVEKNRERIAVQ